MKIRSENSNVTTFYFSKNPKVLTIESVFDNYFLTVFAYLDTP